MTHLRTVAEEDLTPGTWKIKDGFAYQWIDGAWKRATTVDELINTCREDTSKWFPLVKNDLAHMVLALNEEAGEVAGALKKGQRGTLDYEKALKNIGEESVDVLIYLCNIWGILGIDPVEIFNQIKIKNEKRFGKVNA